MPNLIPMPDYIIETQQAYATMLARVSEIIRGHDLIPQSAILLAAIGDQKIRCCDLLRLGYYIGTNQFYTLQKLEQNGYLVKGENKTDARSRIVRLTPKGLGLAARIRREMSMQKEAA